MSSNYMSKSAKSEIRQFSLNTIAAIRLLALKLNVSEGSIIKDLHSCLEEMKHIEHTKQHQP